MWRTSTKYIFAIWTNYQGFFFFFFKQQECHKSRNLFDYTESSTFARDDENIRKKSGGENSANGVDFRYRFRASNSPALLGEVGWHR